MILVLDPEGTWRDPDMGLLGTPGVFDDIHSGMLTDSLQGTSKEIIRGRRGLGQ